jgi:hypothetical protein
MMFPESISGLNILIVLIGPTRHAKRCVDAKVDLQTQRANTQIDIQSVLVDLTY